MEARGNVSVITGYWSIVWLRDVRKEGACVFQELQLECGWSMGFEKAQSAYSAWFSLFFEVHPPNVGSASACPVPVHITEKGYVPVSEVGAVFSEGTYNNLFWAGHTHASLQSYKLRAGGPESAESLALGFPARTVDQVREIVQLQPMWKTEVTGPAPVLVPAAASSSK